ncbi:MAG: sulfoxide reductase heme-binding subunit YedZ [Proteobacteria bacterium]|nr:sulfoxide reductase heme-binding subunit YedZ [Pseudomonadota bacterium]
MSGAAPAAAPSPARRPPRKRVLAPWKDRQGRFSWMKALVLAAAFVPGLVTVWWATQGQLGGRPVMEAIHQTGLWAVRFLLIALAVSPARAVFDAARVILLRRMLGLTALAYALAHFGLYILYQHGNLATVASEIALRFYLLIGFAALLVLAALGVTSTDAMIRRMGAWWKRLHVLAYPVAAVALLHYFIQTKANVTEAVVFAGFYLWLMGLRLLPAAWRSSPVALLGLAGAAGLATAGVEFAWYAIATGINPWRVLAASETLRYGLRPAHIVALCGLGVAVVAAGRRLLRRLTDGGQMAVSRV